MLSFAQSTAFTSGCSLTSAETTWLARCRLPVRRLRTHDPQARRLRRVLEPELALDAVEGVRRALEDRDRIAARETLRDGLADQPRALAVVGPDERDGDLALGQHGGIEAVVDVHDDDAGVGRSLRDGDEGARVGGREDDRLHAARDHLLDELDLPRDVLLVLDAGGDELVRVGVRRLVLARAVLHGLEELVRERLHHERDDRLLVAATARDCRRERRTAGAAS